MSVSSIGVCLHKTNCSAVDPSNVSSVITRLFTVIHLLYSRLLFKINQKVTLVPIVRLLIRCVICHSSYLLSPKVKHTSSQTIARGRIVNVYSPRGILFRSRNAAFLVNEIKLTLIIVFFRALRSHWNMPAFRLGERLKCGHRGPVVS